MLGREEVRRVQVAREIGFAMLENVALVAVGAPLMDDQKRGVDRLPAIHRIIKSPVRGDRLVTVRNDAPIGIDPAVQDPRKALKGYRPILHSERETPFVAVRAV